MKILHLMAGAPLYTNTFLLIGANGLAAAIDPAAGAQRYLDLLADNHARLTYIFLTHGHYDHVEAVAALREQTEACVVMQEADAKGGRLFPFVTPDREYTDGETIEVDTDLSLRVICTPGHSAGSVCLYCEDSELLFSGDTLFAGGIGRMDLEGGNGDTMRHSLLKLLDAVPGNPQVLPGHGEFSTMDAERAHNPYLQSLSENAHFDSEFL